MDLLDKIMAYEGGEMDEDSTIEFFQELIDNGMAWTLQGHYGRTAKELIEAGLCKLPSAARAALRKGANVAERRGRRGMKMKAREMQLGDRIRTADPSGAFRDCVVKQITEKEVTLFRPYVHTADFSYTGGVICYIGVEEYQIPREGDTEYEWLQSVKLR